MSTHERLSMLLSGDLSEGEASELRGLIDTDASTAAAWAELLALTEALAALPHEAPPAELDAAVLAATPRDPRRAPGRLGWIAAGFAAAAAALTLALHPASPSTLVLAEGSQVVEGEVRVLTGAGAVDVDGRARIDVEPARPLAREWAQEDESMKHAALGALAGAIVTIAVYEGSALITAEDGSAVRVEEGETRTVGEAPRGPVPMIRKVRLPGPGSGPSPSEALEVTDLESALARIVALEEENAALQFEATMARGQVRTHEGTPRAWPDDLPEGFAPEAFEAWVRERTAGIPDAEVAAVDCEEYPCIALLRSDSESPDWHRDVAVVHDLAEDHGFGEEVGVMGMVMVEDSDQGQLKTYGFALSPGEESEEDRQRTEYRVRTLFDDLADEP